MTRRVFFLLLSLSILAAITAAVVITDLVKPAIANARLDTPDMYISIEDEKLDWTTTEQIRVLAFGWSGEEMIIAPEVETAPALANLKISRPTLRVRKYEDQFSENLQEAQENASTLDAVTFSINWPGKVYLGYRLKNVKVASMRTLATDQIATRPYEEIVFVFDGMEIDTTGLQRN